MFWNLILQMIAGILGLWLADKYVVGVQFTGPFFVIPRLGMDWAIFLRTLVFVGACLGFLNFFVKPILNAVALPLRIITFNLFSLILAMAMVLIVDLIFPELIIKGIKPLFWTTIIVWALSFFLLKWLPEKSSLSQK